MTVKTVVQFVLVASLCGCASSPQGGEAPAEQPAAAETPRIVRVLLDTWKQKVDADLAAGTLRSSKTEYEYPSPTSGTPSSSKAVPGLDMALSEARRAAIASFVAASGFLDLEAAYGADEGQRFYPYRIEVSFSDDSSKTVLFRSSPDHERPEAFSKLEEFLKALPQSAGE